MKLKDKYNDPNNMVEYILDTHDGERVKSEMPATVAEEIAQRANTLALRDEKGFEIDVNGEMFFPKDIFDFQDGEIEGLKPKKSSRPKKAELLEEAGKEMTNPQLHQAIENAKQENAEKRGKTTEE